MDGKERRVNLYDATGRYRGCLYPERFLLVLRERKIDTQLDLRPYFASLIERTDKADARQNENSLIE